MSTFELWLTPSITLSLILESETPAPSFIRWASSWLLYFRPALLRQALAYELEQRPGQDVVSAGTLRVVDYAFWRNTTGEGGSLYRPADADSLSQSIAVSEGIEVPSLEYDLLSTALERVLRTYAIVDVVQELAETQFPSDGSADGQLKELWSILKPEAELPSMSGKHWQEVRTVWSLFPSRTRLTCLARAGRLPVRRAASRNETVCSPFRRRNVSPATDFRGVGMLGMQAFLYFARTYRDRAAEIVDEAIGGGESWYPLALASIHMTAFALDLATSRDLQLFLLRAVQTRPETASAASSDALTKDADVDIEPFLRIASDLLLLFHSHWRQGGFTVMQFEQTSKAFQAALRPWIRRGILDGRALGWETWEEGAVKLE
uniref:BY PROTMAP: gi/472587500/gb/EMS24996.1/ ELMO domain containing protein [Rhodosporidium toruloides NP11] gi/647398549/emb/CDR42566.1/ RHTO0S07e01310g1_1 [Rhodosporidium toruloides] n=1 Tax=Rhodotorula toruloides TaxID=5286 RepID=A0A0K3CS71_RHOTO